MKTDIQSLKESFWWGYDTYYLSRVEANSAWDLFHNRQWSEEQLSILEMRGQPTETFNVIKLFARMLVGYYSTVVTTVRALPKGPEDETVAALLSDAIQSVFDNNNMDSKGDKIKLSGIISGLMVAQVEPYYTGKRDEFNRPIYDVKIDYIPDHEVVLDPMSTLDDYSDARFLHRFKWLSADTVRSLWGEKVLKKLEENNNHLNIDESEYEFAHGDTYYGRYKVFDNYLITHTVIMDDKNKRYSIFWSGDTEIERTEITHREVKWPYRVIKLNTSNFTEYYGVFREVLETQKAINQAIVKLQLMVNTQKIFVEENAVGNIDKFTDAVNRVNGVIPVRKLIGIQVENMSKEALDQYQIIDKALDRIQKILSINDSFLGQAFASDSGRKVKLQQNATVMALRYLTVRIEAFYEWLGKDVSELIKQYFNAHQILRIADVTTGQRFVELNKPMQIFNGNTDEAGSPEFDTEFEQVYNPENNEPEVTESNQLVFAPIPEESTDIAFVNADIKVESTPYADEDERTQLMIESIMSGQMGQMLAQVNPAAYFKAAALNMKTMKTRFAPQLAELFEETAQLLTEPEQEEAAAELAKGGSGQQGTPISQELKLPTNTNEGPA